MSQASDVKELFPDALFGPLCAESEIRKAEAKLGHALPTVLVDLYRAFDGFRGSTNAQFFFPLNDAADETGDSLVGHTLFLRGEDYFPSYLQRAVAFGTSGVGPCWLIFLDDPDRVVLWDAEWEEEEYEKLEGTIVDVWRAAKLEYDSLDGDT